MPALSARQARALFGALLLAGCGTPGPAVPVPRPLAWSQRVAIDGVIDFAVFERTETRTLDFIDSASGQVLRRAAVRWGIVADDQDVYLAVEWEDDTRDGVFGPGRRPVDFDGIRFLFDGTGDGGLDTADDVKTILAADSGSHYSDQHPASGDAVDFIGEGFGRLAWDASARRYRAELIFPLANDARGQDASVTRLSRYNLVLFDHVRPDQGAGAVAVLEPGTGAAWPSVPVPATAVVHDRPSLPTDLGGRIAFISDHEDPSGEIYFFDPATRAVTRVTHLPGLYKDNLSLSHDRRRIAFHGATAREDAAGYEIFVVNADGSGLRQLTSNRLLDGHPAWSPDDTRLVYASFRSHHASLVLVTESGGEIATLTPPGVHGNDPDFLPDGRIVFKTDLFSTATEVRIAVMRGDGTEVRALTSRPGVSDHDPSGSDERVVFERFPEPVGGGPNPEEVLGVWDLVEARTDGGGERTLLSDGWANWIPVLDPSRRYVAYQKSTGAYTAVHLMSASGQELGRLIPGITRIRYLDWK